MSLLQPNRDPSDRQIRQFGAISLLALPLLAWLWGFTGNVVTWLAIAGVLIAIASFVQPRLVKPIWIGLMCVAAPIGAVIGELSMILIYYGVFVPIGLLFRLTGRDELGLKLDRDASSYWAKRKQPKNVTSYFRQS